MHSLILQTTARLLLGWMLLFSLWVLLRGHNFPGGGFIGGLMAASSLAFYLLAYGRKALLGILFFKPITWMLIGLALILSSALAGMLTGHVFLTALWAHYLSGYLNTPLLFDAGIYLAVCFSVMHVLLALEKSG